MRKILTNECTKEKPNSSALGAFNEAYERYSGYVNSGDSGVKIARQAIKDFDENVKVYNTKEKTKGLTNVEKRFRSDFKQSLAGAKSALRNNYNKKA